MVSWQASSGDQIVFQEGEHCVSLAQCMGYSVFKSFQSETVKFDEVKEQVIEEDYIKKAEQKPFNVEDFEEGKVKEGQDEMNIKVAEKKSFPLRQ